MTTVVVVVEVHSDPSLHSPIQNAALVLSKSTAAIRTNIGKIFRLSKNEVDPEKKSACAQECQIREMALSDLVPDSIHEWKPRGENQGLSQCPD